MSILGMFHPDTLTTGLAPFRSVEVQVAVRVCDSPGNSVMSLFCQIEDCSSLSPAAGVVPVPRRTSARSRKATAEELFVIVTVVARSAPFGPDCVTVLDVTAMDEDGIVASVFS